MYLQAGSSANSLYTAHASNVVLEWQPITRDDPSCHADGCRDPGCWSQKFRQKRRANATCRCGVLPPSCQSFSGLPSWRVSYGRTDVCCFRQSSQISQLTSSMKEHCSRTILLCCLHTSGYWADSVPSPTSGNTSTGNGEELFSNDGLFAQSLCLP